MVDEYAHWLNLDTGVLEFRLLKDQWLSGSSHWRLNVSFNPFQASMVKANRGIDTEQRLIDVRSPTFQMVAAQVRRLEDPHFVIITFDENESRLLMDLPRFRLQFALVDDELESQNLRSMVIDSDQSAGTMLGLQNQLLLRARELDYEALPTSRCVLIPHGTVLVEEDPVHVTVRIDTSSQKRALYHKYDIDDRLGHLASSGTGLTSRLFKIYLHALTSHCLPDPLTGRTGTEEALHELSSAAVRSFQALAGPDAALLALIGGLTPRRRYYPPNSQAAQDVTWTKELPALAQHGAFAAAASLIIQHGKALQVFPMQQAIDYNPHLEKLERNSILGRRALGRHSVFYPQDLAARTLTTPSLSGEDVAYTTRDRANPQQAQAATWASQLATTGNKYVTVDLRDRIIRNSVYISVPTNAFSLGYRYGHVTLVNGSILMPYLGLNGWTLMSRHHGSPSTRRVDRSSIARMLRITA
jgi:hypothetical protein